GAKAALALRMGRIGENGKRAGEKAFDDGSRKPVRLAPGAVALIPIKAVSLQSHGSRKDRQLYRQTSRLAEGLKLFVKRGYSCGAPEQPQGDNDQRIHRSLANIRRIVG